MREQLEHTKDVLPMSATQDSPQSKVYRTRRRPKRQTVYKDSIAQVQSVPPLKKSESTNDNRATLLATKSNYEWITEGKHAELGLHFPDTMVTSVVSKRKIHKIEEQDRRNRLKSALEEMAEVLFGGRVTAGPGGKGVLVEQNRQETSKIGKSESPEDGGGKTNLSRIKLIELATERLRAQNKVIEEMRQDD